eukprot:scaffold301_cov243-Pinguiococcus_pyrenoidosus.AAC.81
MQTATESHRRNMNSRRSPKICLKLTKGVRTNAPIPPCQSLGTYQLKSSRQLRQQLQSAEHWREGGVRLHALRGTIHLEKAGGRGSDLLVVAKRLAKGEQMLRRRLRGDNGARDVDH